MSAATIVAEPATGRSRVAAGLLSLIAPGVGHYYVGQGRRGLLLFAASLALQPLLFAAAFLLPPTFNAIAGFVVAVLAIVIVFSLFIVIDAARLARRGTRPNARWYTYCGLILAVWVVCGAESLLGQAIRPTMSWRIFSIPSASMEPTLHVGEQLIADTRYYGTHAPARGDLVIYRLPSDNETIYIKRVIALPGERVAFRDGHAIVNGTMQAEPFADFGDPKAYYNTTGEVTVPADRIFVAGDNRANSSDSRVTRHGTVPVENLVARATQILLSQDWERDGLWIGSPQ